MNVNPDSRAALDVAELCRRVTLFQSRPSAVTRARMPVESALQALFQHPDKPVNTAVFEPWEVELLESALASWRRQRDHAMHSAFFTRVFDSLPTPIALFGRQGTIWNQALAAHLAADSADLAEQRACIGRLAPAVYGSADLRAPVLYFALGRRLYRLSVRSFPDLDCSAAYLFPDGRVLPDVEPVVQQLLAFRLSGLSIKQIAPVLGVSYSRAEGLSKRHRRHLMRLRSESCPELVG